MFLLNSLKLSHRDSDFMDQERWLVTLQNSVCASLLHISKICVKEKACTNLLQFLHIASICTIIIKKNGIITSDMNKLLFLYFQFLVNLLYAFANDLVQFIYLIINNCNSYNIYLYTNS